MAELLLAKVRTHFHELLEPDANPLEVALALMDESSIGKARHANEFHALHQEIKAGLRAQVDDNFEGFNSFVGVYHHVVSDLSEGSGSIANVQSLISNARTVLTKKRPHLKELQQSSVRYAQMLDLLDVVEGLKKFPDKFEEQIAQRKWHDALSTLDSALETIVNHNLGSAVAIEPLHQYIVDQQPQISKLLLDELVANVYLNSPGSSNFSKNMQLSSDASTELLLRERIRLGNLATRPSASLAAFLKTLDSPLNTTETSNSLDYLRLLLETFSRMGRLPQALEHLQSACEPELHRLRNTAINNAQRREANNDFAPSTQKKALAFSVLSMLSRVLEHSRVIYEVAARKGVSFDLKTSIKSIQNAAFQFASSYIDEPPPTPPRPRGRSMDLSLHKTKLTFVFDDVVDKDFAELNDSLKDSIKQWVPGLATHTSDADPLSFDTRKSSEGFPSVLGTPSVLNIQALQEPLTLFDSYSQEILEGIEIESGIFKPFFQTEFLPRLKTSFASWLDTSIQQELLVQHQDSYLAQKPITSFAVSFIAKIQSFMELFEPGFAFKDSFVAGYASLIESAHTHLNTSISDLMSVSLKGLATGKDLRPLYRRMLSDSGCESLDKELEVHLSQRARLAQGDLLDSENMPALALVATSMKWIHQNLQKACAESPLVEEKSSQKIIDVLNGFNGLVLDALGALRCDLLSRVVFYFGRMTKTVQTNIDTYLERDLYLEPLLRSLVELSHISLKYLTKDDSKFLWKDISPFMNEQFVLFSEFVPNVSSAGSKRMFGTILSAQQVLKSIVEDPRQVNFTRAHDFYDALRQSSVYILERYKSGHLSLSLEDVRRLLQIKHKESISNKRDPRDIAQAKQALQEQLETLKSV